LHLILDFPSDPPELEPEIIHHFDSGVSLFWTDFDSLNNACAATASGNNPRSSPMTLKTIATLLILSTLATAGANSASAQDSAIATGTESRPVTMSALSSASV
jgi:hypothetical protein